MPEPCLPIHDLTPFTLQDFPGKIACIVWFSGCNMRCPYCHNPDVVRGKSGRIKTSDVLSFLADRRGLLDGVVLSGGEATLYPGIADFAQTVKSMGFAVKLDTNGTRPRILRHLLDKGLLDYVALDYKAPACKFKAVTGIQDRKSFDASLALLCGQSAVPVEIRTTVHTDLTDKADLAAIIADLEKHEFRGQYFIQNFRLPPGGTLGRMPQPARSLSPDTIARPQGFDIAFRGFTNMPRK